MRDQPKIQPIKGRNHAGIRPQKFQFDNGFGHLFWQNGKPFKRDWPIRHIHQHDMRRIKLGRIDLGQISGHRQIIAQNLIHKTEKDRIINAFCRQNISRKLCPANFALNRLTGVVDKMLIFPQNMLDNMNKFPGLVMSQRVLLALTQAGVSREDAYVMVQRNALKVWEERVDFREQLLADKDVVAALGAEGINAKFDMDYHTKHVDTIFRRVFGG